MRGTYSHTPHDRPSGARRPLDFRVVPTEVRHGPGVYDVVRLANGYPLDRPCDCIGDRAVAEQVRRFPRGQFVAVTSVAGREKVIGMATTMITARPPDAPPLRWHEVIGDHGLARHDPEGDWLYGVEIAVHPDYQRRGVASALYRARFALVDELGLEGWYAGGMLMGYHRFREVMSPREYARKVIAGELRDPTVTMQLNRGLEARGIIEDYYPEPKAGGAAVLIVWRVGSQGRARTAAPGKARSEARRPDAPRARSAPPRVQAREGHRRG